MRKHLVSLVLAAAGVVGGCQQQQQKQAEESITSIPPQSFKRDWSADLTLKGDAIDRVFLEDDAVVAYTKNNVAHVVNRQGGFIRFTTRLTQSPVKALEPVFLKDRIAFPTNSTFELYRRDGRFERSFETQTSLRTNAVGDPKGTRLYVGVDARGSGRLAAIETTPGDYKPVRQVWELMSDKGAPISGAPALHGGVVYVGFEDGNVYAVSADNRAPIWATSSGQIFQTFGPVQADLKADDQGVYVPSTDSKLYCLDKTQGRLKWTFYAGVPLRTSPDVTATMVYLPIEGRGIVAIDKLNGPAIREAKWTVRDAVKLVAEDEKYAYFQRKDNRVIAIEKATGEQRFASKRTDLIAFATNLKDATIYAGTKDGHVVAMNPVLKPGFVGEIALDDARRVDTVAAAE